MNLILPLFLLCCAFSLGSCGTKEVGVFISRVGTTLRGGAQSAGNAAGRFGKAVDKPLRVAVETAEGAQIGAEAYGNLQSILETRTAIERDTPIRVTEPPLPLSYLFSSWPIIGRIWNVTLIPEGVVSINLVIGHGEAAMHISIRPQKHAVVFNSYHKGYGFKDEYERHHPLPEVENGIYVVLIEVKKAGFAVQIGESWHAFFRHRLPYSKIKGIRIDGKGMFDIIDNEGMEEGEDDDENDEDSDSK